MRTPLACRLRVMISPWKSFPTFLNEPMVAMSLLLFVFRARDHRGLDGDRQGRRRSATHPKGWSAAEDAVDATFLPREEWALAQGKKVVSTALRLRRSRRSRSSARSSHQRGDVRRVLNHKSGRRWRASVWLGKRSKRFSGGKETKGSKRRDRQHKANGARKALDAISM